MRKKNIIYLNHKVTSFNFYAEFLEELSEYYAELGGYALPPILSLELTEFIDPIVLPNILAVGLRLRRFYNKPIKLLLNYNPKLLYFLERARFFMHARKYSNLDVFEFDEDYVGGFDESMQHQDEHIIHRYNPDLKYYEIENEEDQIVYRKNLIYHLREYSFKKDFKPVLEFLGRLNQEEIDLFLDIFSEIISNAILYSLSESFAMIFASKYKTTISLSDIGIGFNDALKKKNSFSFIFSKKLKKDLKNYYSDELRDFITIFEVLNYSQNKNRFNLWVLKNLVVSKKGIFRIHYNSTQITFTKKCFLCKKNDNLTECAKCFLKNYNKRDLRVSPLRLFNHTYKGVHIEIELNNYDEGEYV